MTMSDVKLNRFAVSARSVLLRSDVFGGTALVALLVIAGVLTLLEPQFLTSSNLLNIGRQASVLVIVACGMTMVILSGNIDLSAGSGIALCSVIGASLATNVGLNAPLTVAMMIALGAVIGGLKGLLIAWVNQFVHRNFGDDDRASGAGAHLHGRLSDLRRSRCGSIPRIWSRGRSPNAARRRGGRICPGRTASLEDGAGTGNIIYAIGGNETSSHIAGVPVSLTCSSWRCSWSAAGFVV